MSHSSGEESTWNRPKAVRSTVWVILVGQFTFALVAIGSGVVSGDRSLVSGADAYDSIAESWYLFLIPFVLAVPYYYQYPKTDRKEPS